MTIDGKPIPPVADLGAVRAYALTAKTLIQTARDLRERGATQTEIDTIIDGAELQIQAMLDSMPRDEGEQLALRVRQVRRTGR